MSSAGRHGTVRLRARRIDTTRSDNSPEGDRETIWYLFQAICDTRDLTGRKMEKDEIASLCLAQDTWKEDFAARSQFLSCYFYLFP